MTKSSNKYYLVCDVCGHEIGPFSEWFANGQKCPVCQASNAKARYHQSMDRLTDIFEDNRKIGGVWRYFEFLPLENQDNIVSINSYEGDVSIERWRFLETFAKEKYGITLKTYAHRQDRNYATGTWKDLAGTLVASVLKENDVHNYVVASTGNIGTAFSRFLKEVDVTLYAFVPHDSPKQHEAEISCYGQKVFRVDGDYTVAKDMAAEFAAKHNYMLAAGTFDPMRIEAKKTMAYEWVRRIHEFPTVYIQALSGGTGPLGISKACEEMKSVGIIDRSPRHILVQSDRCAPMALAWDKAKKDGFPEGWEKDFPVIDHPTTAITTLATGNPTAYPSVGKLVKDSGGEIVTFPEDRVRDIGLLAAYEIAARIGPAAAIGLGGYFMALKQGLLKDGDRVLVNIGEGIRRSPAYVESFAPDSSGFVSSVDDCTPFDTARYRRELWEQVESL